MSRRPRQLRRIEEENSFNVKYQGPFPLHEAAASGDVDVIQKLLDRKDINAYDTEGLMPLHRAVCNGHLETVSLLISLGADINTVEKKAGRTSMHLACLSGYCDILNVLRKYGGLVYDMDKYGTFPIHLAAEGGHCQVIDILKAAGATINCADLNNAGPLHYAARLDQPGAIERLCQYKAPLEDRDKNGHTALHYAVKHGCVSAIRKLVQLGADLHAKCLLTDTPLHLAVRHEMIVSIQTLAELGCDLYARNKDDECALHLAAKLGHWRSVKQLLECGVGVAVEQREKVQAIHIAASNGHCEVLIVLKKCRVDLNARDKRKYTPLHYAVKSEQTSAIQKLVEIGADINAPGRNGHTVIHAAAKRRQAKMIQLLCNLGADCNIENKMAVFPLYYAIMNDDHLTSKTLIRNGAQLNRLNKEGDSLVHIFTEESATEALESLHSLKPTFSLHNGKGDTCVHMAANALDGSVLNKLKHLGVNMSATNKHGLTALHVAVMEGRVDQVDLLHDVGVDFDCRTKNFQREEDGNILCNSHWPPKDVEKQDYWKIKLGLSPLHLALLYERGDIFEHLITCGCDIDQQTDDGESVFHLAVLFNMTDWLQKLIAFDADRNCKDKFGRTPMHYAAHSGSLDDLRFLLKFGAIITETDNDGRQPLHYAAQDGHYLLLPEFTAKSSFVDINCRDKDGRTPLHFACEQGMMDTILELVQLNADLHARDENGDTVVHVAATNGCHETIVQLATLGCSMDLQNKELKTPLHLAGENGRGDAMEYLLMCGCNPTIKDNQDLLPSTYRLRGEIKRTVHKRMQEATAHNSTKNKTGEIDYQSRIVTSGVATEFEKLGIMVTVQSHTPVSPIVFLHRAPADGKHLDIPVSGLEEILRGIEPVTCSHDAIKRENLISDVYELRVLNLSTPCTILMEIPMDGYPGKFESFLRTSTNAEFKEFTTSEEKGVPLFLGKIPIEPGTSHKFAVIVRPQIYYYKTGPDGGTILSDENRKIRLEIPGGAFSGDTELRFQVLKTDNIERSGRDRLFATDFINITTNDVQPSKNIRIQFPLHIDVDDPDELVVMAIENEQFLEDENRWRILHSNWKIQNQCISFLVSHLSMFVAIHLTDARAVDGRKRQAREKIKSALQRETSVVFFYAVCQKKDAFLTIFECTTPGRFKRRSEFWENEGFRLHPQIRHSGHFVAKPNQKYFVTISGNIQHAGNAKGVYALTFNPRAYKFQSFYLKEVTKGQLLIGEMQVSTIEEGQTEKQFVTSLPVEITKDASCVLS